MTAILINGFPYYVTVEEVTAYATARGITLVSPVSVLVTQASDYFESLAFKGVKTNNDQPFKFPRKYLRIDCNTLPDDEIPQLVKDAISEIAIANDQGYNPIGVVDRTVKREEVDVIEVEYMDGATSTANVRSISVKLNKLLASSTGGNFINVWKA